MKPSEALKRSLGNLRKAYAEVAEDVKVGNLPAWVLTDLKTAGLKMRSSLRRIERQGR